MIQLRRHGTLVRALVLALIAALAIPLSAVTAQAHPGHGDDTFAVQLLRVHVAMIRPSPSGSMTSEVMDH